MRLKGTGVSKGIGIGTAYVVKDFNIDITKKEAGAGEAVRFSQAVSTLTELLQKRADKTGPEQAEILESHIMLLSDPVMLADTLSLIAKESCNSEYAIDVIFEQYAEIFRQSGNDLLMMRAGDMRDIKNNLIAVMNGQELPDLSAMPKGSILAARELTTSLAAGINPALVDGMITDVGGATSHMAIIARSMGLPAVTGIAGIRHGDEVIVNGGTGEVIVGPTQEELTEHRALIEEQRQRQKALQQYRGVPSVTLDGRHLELCANIGLEADIQSAFDADAEGVGLFRSEFLFMNRNAAPTEEEQFLVYKKVASTFGKRPVIIRTLDIGGDKEIPYLGLEKEENPFLGWRAIRYCLDREELFASQIRAILRASAFGNIKIMLPMVSNIMELRQAKALISRLKDELTERGTAFDPHVAVGIMVETPAAAVLADSFAKESDFFSIGTNDLTQYTMAVDRGNQKVANLYTVYSPAVLRLIYNVAQEALRHHIPCGICGEAGADPLLIKFLVGCGMSELSMTASSVLEARSIIRQMNYADTAAKITENIKQLASVEDSCAFLKQL